MQDRIARDNSGRFAVERNYSTGVEPGEIFVQNAELHTHGFVTPDLGMAAYRNSCILREICGREVYPVERSIAFQQFGAPQAFSQSDPIQHLPEQMEFPMPKSHVPATAQIGEAS